MAVPSSIHLFLHLRQPPPPPNTLLFLTPLFTVSSLRHHHYSPLLSPLPLSLRRFSKPSQTPFSLSTPHTHSPLESHHQFHYIEPNADDDDDTDDDDVRNGESETLLEEGIVVVNDDELNNPHPHPNLGEVKKPPILTVKEKKELVSYALSLGKKLKTQQVGKYGVTTSLVSSFLETLEANELLKLKIHRNCPEELEDAVKQLEEATGSVGVGQIGRTVILYRPSLTRLKAEEKKKQTHKVFVGRESNPKPTVPQKARVVKLFGRGRRGSSRF